MNKGVKARKKKMVLYCHRGPSVRHVVLLAVGCCLDVITFATCSFFFFSFSIHYDQMKSCEARTVQDICFAQMSTFTSGLRSEHFNHS